MVFTHVWTADPIALEAAAWSEADQDLNLRETESDASVWKWDALLAAYRGPTSEQDALRNSPSESHESEEFWFQSSDGQPR